MADTKVKIACWLYGLKHRKEFSAARPLEGNAAHMDADEKYWWGYKYYCGPVEEEEPGSGLERFFHEQDLDFATRDGFVEGSGMTVCAGGDILAHPGLNPDTIRALWDDVRDFYFSGDVAYANLETPVAPSMPPSYIPKSILVAGALNNSPEMFDSIVDGGKGINLFSTANNHCLDQGEAGLRETLDFLDKRGYRHVGTARSPEERDTVVMLEKGGVKTAFISFTFALNWSGLPEGKEYLANYVRLNKPGTDISPVAKQVEAAKAAGADAVVALLHWSLEFESFPASNIVGMGHRLAELGIDVIIGNHPHNVQPMERYGYLDKSTGKRRESLIIYALGDLLSIHRTLPDSRLACLARMRISKGKDDGADSVRVTSLEVLPVYLHVRKHKGECTDYRVLDFRKLAGELHSGIDRFKLGRTKTREVFRLEALMNRVLYSALK
jgi:poly-gamma-glutamate capsule biosynthesis protein CapA/YwtB (metallophosphatase superfamily)